MQRTLGRAYQRLQGNHPRRQDGERFMELVCDAILVLAVLDFLGGVALIVWGCITGLEPIRIAAGVVLVILSPLLLLLWERMAWEPFAERLAQMD